MNSSSKYLLCFSDRSNAPIYRHRSSLGYGCLTYGQRMRDRWDGQGGICQEFWSCRHLLLDGNGIFMPMCHLSPPTSPSCNIWGCVELSRAGSDRADTESVRQAGDCSSHSCLNHCCFWGPLHALSFYISNSSDFSQTLFCPNLGISCIVWHPFVTVSTTTME